MEASPIQVITEFKTREELARALKDCVIGMYTPTQCTIPFTHSFLEAHQRVFEQFDMLHHDIHFANMYVKNLGELPPGPSQTGSVLGDWGFAKCKDMAKVVQCCEPMNYAHPKPVAKLTITSCPPSSLSMASSLTPPPTSPDPSQNLHQFLHGTDRTCAAGMALQNYRELSTTDVDSDLDTKRTSAFSSSPESNLNPWHRRSKYDLAERTVSRHLYK
jgi:hypothetical protein